MTSDSRWIRLARRFREGLGRGAYKIEHVRRWRILFIVTLAILFSLPVTIPSAMIVFYSATRNTRWAINDKLETYGLPRLTDTAKILKHEEHDYFFHLCFDLKVSMDEKSIREYEAALHFEKLIIGDKKGMARVVDDGDSELEESNSRAERPELVCREQTGAWWDTKSIQNGVLYRRECNASSDLNYAIYIDHGRNLIYIHWDR